MSIIIIALGTILSVLLDKKEPEKIVVYDYRNNKEALNEFIKK